MFWKWKSISFDHLPLSPCSYTTALTQSSCHFAACGPCSRYWCLLPKHKEWRLPTTSCVWVLCSNPAHTWMKPNSAVPAWPPRKPSSSKQATPTSLTVEPDTIHDRRIQVKLWGAISPCSDKQVTQSALLPFFLFSFGLLIFTSLLSLLPQRLSLLPYRSNEE